tara:strand:+ start:483 stop:776 length:294 start_codon:yes stop_codon:yes gene_type:complete
MELTKLSPELIASNKTMKRRALKYCLIEHLLMKGYNSDDQGDHITFDNGKFHIWYRPSHHNVDVYLSDTINSTNEESDALETHLNKLYSNTMRKLGL